MAATSTSRELRNLESRSFYSSKKSQVNFVEGELLSIKDVPEILKKKGKDLNESGKKMLVNLENLEPQSFENMQQEFKISHLQHVTNESSMKRICEQECFKIIKSAFRSGPQEIYGDLSFWTAIVATKDVTEARKQSLVKAKEKIRWLSTEDEIKVRAQFANSPAFKPASRFGNFKFSFQLSDLLDLYKTQHCGGEEPQLKILGTDMYKQEITHYILVHGSEEDNTFRSLPNVDTDEFGQSFAYLKNKTLYWKPESTSISLKVKISKGSQSPKKCYKNCDRYIKNRYCVHIWERNYKVSSLWNHLVVVFHLPNRRVLKIQRKQLLKSLTACNIGKSPLLPEPEHLKLEKAKEIVKKMKEKKSENGRPKRKSSPQVHDEAKKIKQEEPQN